MLKILMIFTFLYKRADIFKNIFVLKCFLLFYCYVKEWQYMKIFLISICLWKEEKYIVNVVDLYILGKNKICWKCYLFLYFQEGKYVYIF